ncbi:MAG TPA: response regulator transcription factor [Acidimicrobiales bacterium]|nr:response regulator transcription factor [Acidimicrobiales bacterium]
MRLLLVDDERRLADSLKRGLTADGFNVDLADDGISGLWLAKNNTYDVIVLDLMLPGKNGFQVCADLRAASVWTPVLVLTAKTGEYDEIESLDIGADDFLSKPFSYEVLLAHLRALLRRGTRERPVQLRAGDLVIDPAAHTCHRGSTLIELTPREFGLLEYLLRYHDEILTKVQILDHVWGSEYEGESNVVEVYISYLRRKIDRPFSMNSIRTVPGVGYRLVSRG